MNVTVCSPWVHLGEVRIGEDGDAEQGAAEAGVVGVRLGRVRPLGIVWSIQTQLSYLCGRVAIFLEDRYGE